MASGVEKSMQELGFAYKSFLKGGIKYTIRELASFRNPNKYGNDSYTFPRMGVICPVGKMKVNLKGQDKPFYLNNLTIGYLAGGRENRKRIVRAVDQMTGMESQAVGGNDLSNVYYLTEFMLIAMECNQMVLVQQA